MKRLLTLALATSLLALSAAASEHSDVVDGDAIGGWTGSGSFGTISGVSVPAGTNVWKWTAAPTWGPNRCITKDLGITLQAGYTYTITCDFNIGDKTKVFVEQGFTNATSEHVAFGFFNPAGIDLELNDNAERQKIRDAINDVLQNAADANLLTWHSREIPPSDGSEWKTWSYTFTLPGGSPYAGKASCFGIYGGYAYKEEQPPRTQAADNIHITITSNQRDIRLIPITP